MAKAEFPRRGAWAVVDGRVGIIDAITPDGASFHVVDDKGDTTIVLPGVPLGALTQATHAQIPAPRRPKPEHAERLGYRTGKDSTASPVTTHPALSGPKAPARAGTKKPSPRS